MSSDPVSDHSLPNGRVRIILHWAVSGPRRSADDSVHRLADAPPVLRRRPIGARRLVRAGSQVLALAALAIGLQVLVGWLVGVSLGLIMAVCCLPALRPWVSRRLTLHRSPGGRHRRQPHPHGYMTIVEDGLLVRLTSGAPSRRHRALA